MDCFSSFFAVLMLFAGLFITVRLRFFQFRRLGAAFLAVFGLDRQSKARKPECRRCEKSDGALTPFQAMAAALGGSIGTANIAGVSGAIAIGGAGAVFYMWLAALVGMAVKFSEIVLAIRFREKRGGKWHGGPMLYIEKGLSGTLSQRGARGLSLVFAFFGLLSSLVGTTLVQSNTIAMSAADMVSVFNPSADAVRVRLIAGILTALLVGAVVIGGIKRIGRISELIVPFMAGLYVLICLYALFINRARLGGAFSSIFSGAFGGLFGNARSFSPRTAAGGVFGYGIARAIRIGTARGVYSNEAGVGSAPMAHALAATNEPVRQGMFGIFEVFADTVVMCTLTALVVLTSGSAPLGGEHVSGTGIALRAFSNVLGARTAGVFLAASMLLFAYTSIIGWSVYGLECVKHIAGERARLPYFIVFTLFSGLGAVVRVDFAWKSGEILNYLMAAPNMLAVLLLSGRVKKELEFYR